MLPLKFLFSYIRILSYKWNNEKVTPLSVENKSDKEHLINEAAWKFSNILQTCA